MILIDQLSNVSFSFMFYLRQSAGSKYHKSKSIFIEVLKNDFKGRIETTKAEQKPKLAGHLLLDREAI